MAHPNAAWGIEIGSHAIKAVRLVRNGSAVEVDDFAVVPHKKVLTTPDLDQDEMILISLGQFISQNNLENEHLVMSVPGHAAFARFAKLPPVEEKKIPDIVKFEAVQQIPFPIEDVEWDYETFTSDDSPDTEVGIFAITRQRVQQRLNLYHEVNISPERLTLSPVAVFNAMSYDLDLQAKPGAIMFLDIGTQATDVIIAEEGRCWIRTFPLGGTHFTEAIADAFKLSYGKAEKLKLEAATSKYTKQIMQAMRPVFSDLLQDLQRSIGFYQSAHPDVTIDTVIGLGSTFKIPGLRKFVGQQLQVNVTRLDEYRKISVAGREAASFAEHAVNFGSAYGLALQGVGLASIDANLVPVNTLREHMWHQKTKWFAAAAAIVIVGAGLSLINPMVNRQVLGDGQLPSNVSNVLSQGKQLNTRHQSLQASANIGATTENMMGLLSDKMIWPHLLDDAASALATADPQLELLSSDPDMWSGVDAKDRRLVHLKNLNGDYTVSDDGKSRFINVTMEIEYSHALQNNFLNRSVVRWLRDNTEREGVPYRILVDTVKLNVEDRSEFEVDESGQTQVTREPDGKSGGSSGASRGPRRGGGTPSRGGATGGGQQSNGSSGGGMTMPSGPRRGPKRDAPTGPGGGAMGGGDSSGGSQPGTRPPSRGDQRPDRQPDLSRGGGDAGTGGKVGPYDLDIDAPIPARPDRYKAGDKYFVQPITFTIEIIDEAAKPAPGATADARDGKESGA